MSSDAAHVLFPSDAPKAPAVAAPSAAAGAPPQADAAALEATGMGNRPDFIRAVIREAKRRGAGR